MAGVKKGCLDNCAGALDAVVEDFSAEDFIRKSFFPFPRYSHSTRSIRSIHGSFTIEIPHGSWPSRMS